MMFVLPALLGLSRCFLFQHALTFLVRMRHKAQVGWSEFAAGCLRAFAKTAHTGCIICPRYYNAHDNRLCTSIRSTQSTAE